jgi:hypothetical protein
MAERRRDADDEAPEATQAPHVEEPKPWREQMADAGQITVDVPAE